MPRRNATDTPAPPKRARKASQAQPAAAAIKSDLDSELLQALSGLLDSYTLCTVIDAAWDISQARFAAAVEHQRAAAEKGRAA